MGITKNVKKISVPKGLLLIIGAYPAILRHCLWMKWRKGRGEGRLGAKHGETLTTNAKPLNNSKPRLDASCARSTSYPCSRT